MDKQVDINNYLVWIYIIFFSVQTESSIFEMKNYLSITYPPVLFLSF